MILSPTSIEDHPTGTLNTGGIINGNWQKINNIFDPAHVGAQAGVLAAAQAGMTTITYAASVNVDMGATRLNHLVALAGDLTIAVTNKAAGRARVLTIIGDATARTLTWPVGAVWSGPPARNVAIGETVQVEILSTGITDAGLVLRASVGYADLHGDGMLADSVGTRGIVIVPFSADTAVIASHGGKCLAHPTADATARTLTIPDNAALALPIGFAFSVVNQNAAGVIYIAIGGTDVMRLAGAGTAGTRTLAANGFATAIKITTTEWIISGNGLT